MFVMFPGEDPMLVFMMEVLLDGLVLDQEAVISGVSVCSAGARVAVPAIWGLLVFNLVRNLPFLAFS